MPKKLQREVALLLEINDQVPGRGLPVETACWRPQAGRHNIWELSFMPPTRNTPSGSKLMKASFFESGDHAFTFAVAAETALQE